MLADWTAACGPDDPVLVIPWSDPASDARFIHLRAEPLDVAEIPEAEAYPAMRRALRSLNATQSSFFTAKCDVWTLYPEVAGEELERLSLDLDLDSSEVAFGVASYIDLLSRERSVFASAHVATDRLARLTRRLARMEGAQVSVELVLRPALLSLSATLEGFSFSLYVTAVAGDPETAEKRWGAALEEVVQLLREREWAIPPGSATIDLQPTAAAGE